MSVNLGGTMNVVKKCVEYRVPRLLFASSMTVYGHPQSLPVSEAEPPIAISYYGITKYAAERFALATAARPDLDFDFHVTAFRMFNVYGERQRLDNPYQGIVGIFMGNVIRGEPIIIHSDGEQSRDFVYIGDVVDAWMAALGNPAACGQVFNLGTGEDKSINQLVDTMLTTFGHSRATYRIIHQPERPGDQRHMKAAIAKLEQTLGWRPQVSFEKGLELTLHWVRENGRGQPC